MLTTIKGIYDNGQIVLEEIPPTKKKSKVVVTFLEEIESSSLQTRPFGSLKGKIGIPDNFNEPLDDLKDYMY
ncbi:MAG: DUF2281 domain-containing protein [Bacteroidota bacterium]|nr:DUF2281 domain-containing protein [Bacteroidota bacterium]